MCHVAFKPPPLYFEIPNSLTAAHIENKYPHNFDRDPKDIALEIHDFSGLTDFDHDDPTMVDYAARQVKGWRFLRCRYCCQLKPHCGCGAHDYCQSR